MRELYFGKDPPTKSDEFLEKFQMAFDPPPHIVGKLYDTFHLMDMVAYMQGGPDSMKCIPEMGVIQLWYDTKVEKHTLNPEFTLLYQVHAQKPLFKAPKICNINFWIENDAPPLALFRKFIRFGSRILPLI